MMILSPEKRRCFLIFAMLLIVVASLFSQDLPSGYRSVTLGMSLAEVKDALLSDSLFGYRGDRDVSLLPEQEQVLIQTSGSLYLSQCWFQFNNDKLYTITITMNDELIDYYSIFKTLFDKYGQPHSLSPEKVVWENSSILMSLERPITIKYIDVEVYNSLLRSSVINKSDTENSRQNFLETF